MLQGVRGFVAAAVVSLALCVSPARASPIFPDAVRAAVPMDCTPQCTICHLTNEGKYGTLRPGGFGANLVRLGLVATQKGTVAFAIEEARDAELDSDEDGMTDLEELAAGRDPSNRNPGALTCGGPEYGCGAGRIAKGAPVDAKTAAVVALAIAACGALARARHAHR